MDLLYQNICGKIPEGRHSQSVGIFELYLQQRVTQSLHTAAEQKNTRSWLQNWASYSSLPMRDNTWADFVDASRFTFVTHNFSSSVRSSSSLYLPASPAISFLLLFRVFCLASWTKGLTKSVRSVQQRQSEKTSSSSCSLVCGRGSLATWSSTEDRVMPNDDALRLPRHSSTERKTQTRWWNSGNGSI